MKNFSDVYEEIAQLYTRVIKRDSLGAGKAIEQIWVTFDARAALRAGLIILLLKLDVKEKYQIPNGSLYAAVLQDYPDALPLLQDAITSCYFEWGVVDTTLFYPQRY